MNYNESLDYLNGLLKFGIKFGLDRIKALSEALGSPHKQLRVIHVAGTNGKGSTSTFISSILSEAGYRTGTYLSPYVHDLRERIQINGRMISKEDFTSLINELKPMADRLAETELGAVTEFEVKTMVAFLYFARQNVDFAVLEVGMGGRFDATNIVDPLVAVITNISLDHTERLGSKVEQIAFEKAGIIKTGSVLVTATDDERAWRVILDRCREDGAEVWRVIDSQAKKPSSPSADLQLRYTSKDNEFSLRGGESDLSGLKPGLQGQFQHANAATAAAAILALRRYEIYITTQAISAGIANAYIPGRLEILRDRPTLIIDGAHNPDAASHLARAISKGFKYDRLILVIGMINTHSPDGVLAHLAPMADVVIATQSQWFKASPATEIAESARKFCDNVEIAECVPDAVKIALEIAKDSDLILVTGSFYTIGEVELSADLNGF